MSELAAFGPRHRPPALARRRVGVEDPENSLSALAFSSITNTFVANKFADVE
jgi:hypothetical protein